ncbi:MAG: type VI secretion system contractile sheath small subunit, partial [Helicobacter sp.]|nr:type VI secretion system contractile sheath small subunit [Helicobacter sp.]
MAENSTPPKERINITYKSKTNGQSPEVELPLKLMVMANFTGGNS